ncbi:hypothetical protein [Algicola sagamiensis]|uniref:hypothetical protein n=1 Tax=Algicola sagamiensis TaxID=163869 RepID=UPI000363A25F|nr:hypothetical protein [Algicola sagamiensis]
MKKIILNSILTLTFIPIFAYAYEGDFTASPTQCVNIGKSGNLGYTRQGITNLSSTEPLTVSCPIHLKEGPNRLRNVSIWFSSAPTIRCFVRRTDWRRGDGRPTSQDSFTKYLSNDGLQFDMKNISISEQVRVMTGTLYELECTIPAMTTNGDQSFIGRYSYQS